MKVQEEDSNENKDILVMDEGNYPKQVDDITLKELPKGTGLQISEYDVVIMNLFNISEGGVKKLVDNQRELSKHFDNLLWTGHNLIVITEPEIETEEREVALNQLNLLPFYVPLKKERGEKVDTVNEDYETYFRKHVGNKWKYHLEHPPEEKIDFSESFVKYLPDKYKQDYYPHIYSNPIALNGFNKEISFELRYSFHKKQGIDNRYSGFLTILQPPYETSSVEEGIKTILSDKYNLKIEDKPPTWVKDIKAPGEKKIEREIEKLKQKRKKIEELIKAKRKDKNVIERYKKLLYTSSDELRDITWDTLEEIGFEVEKIDKHKEDGKLLLDTTVVILEIKGRKRSLKTEDGRQLLDWIIDYKQRRIKESQEEDISEVIGLLIGNPYRFQELEDRKEPFPEDLLRFIDNTSEDILLITSWDLFKIFKKIEKDGLTKENFSEVLTDVDKTIINYEDLVN